MAPPLGAHQEYLELALEARLRVKEQLRVLAPHEYGKTAFSYIETDVGRENFVETLERPSSGDLSGIEEFNAVEGEVFEHVQDKHVQELATFPESSTLEFKSSMRFDLKSGNINKALEHAILKSISGFLNAQGGILLVGVRDDGGIVGIEEDYKTFRARQDSDGFQNHLTTLLEQGIGAAATSNTTVSFETVEGTPVCRVAVKPSPSPVFTKQKGQPDAFYVRLGNSTRPLGPRESHEYIVQHFQ